MNLNVPEKWEPFIRSELQSGRYASEAEMLDEALRLLKQQNVEQAEKASVEALLVEGLDSGPSTPMTSQDWDDVEREGRRIIAGARPTGRDE